MLKKKQEPKNDIFVIYRHYISLYINKTTQN